MKRLIKPTFIASLLAVVATVVLLIADPKKYSEMSGHLLHFSFVAFLGSVTLWIVLKIVRLFKR